MRTFDMHIIQIANDEDKKSITRNILEELPEWFGIPEAREEYIRDSAGKVFFCAMENEKDLGFLYLKETGKDTVELAVMGVLKEYHREGIGKELFNRAKKAAKEMGYSFICFVCLYQKQQLYHLSLPLSIKGIHRGYSPMKEYRLRRIFYFTVTSSRRR